MEERRGSRLLTQRQLEVEPARPAPPSPPASPPVASPPSPPVTRSPSEPVPPSNDGLLARQRRWHVERAKFESSRSTGENPK